MNQPTFETLLLEIDAGIAAVTLNRPDTMNAMNVTMRDELGSCFEHLRYRDDVRVVTVTGAGDVFSAGGDVNDFDGQSPQTLHDLMRTKSHRWFEHLWNLPQPTIAAVNGTAAGGGANLALACDLVIASERARFGETFVRIGLLPDLGGLYLLPRIVGLHRAKKLCFTGAVLDAEEAAELGIFSEVVVHENLHKEVRLLAEDLAQRPRNTLIAIKSILNRSFESSMEETLLRELYAQSFLFGTEDHREGLDAFLGRRAPRFP